MKKIKDSQIEVIINALCSNMFSDSERLRDISSVGLKTVIAELPRTTPAVATNASRNITSRMVEAIAKPVSTCSSYMYFMHLCGGKYYYMHDVVFDLWGECDYEC